MRHTIPLATAIALLLACASPSPSTAPSAQPAAQPAATTGAPAAPLSAEQLDELVARVALYPDELLALVLAASTQPTQIVEAGRFLEARKRNPQAAPMDSWEPAVQSLLNYPEVIRLMNQDPAWTQALGDAVASRQADVMDSIQHVRTRALAAGNLKTNEQYVVTQENGIIQIRSADPDLIYVPNYDPIVIYVESKEPVVKYYPPYPCYWCPGAAFGMGMMMGFGWYYNDIYWDDDYDDIDIDIDRPDRPDRPNRPTHPWKPTRPGGGPVASPRPVGGGTHHPVGVGPSTLPARPIGPSARPAQPGMGVGRPAPAGGGGPVGMESLTKLPSGYDARPGYQKPSTHDSLGGYERGREAMRASDRGAQSRGVSMHQSPTADRSRRGSAWGDYSSGSRADSWSSRGAASRGGMHGGGYGGGSRGGGGRGGGGGRR